MSDLSKSETDLPQGGPAPSPGPDGANLPVRSVSEMSQAIKRALEGSFEFVRVRGEVSGFKRAASGHLYFSLKDASAVLDAVCWRGTAGRLGIAPEDGMEVIASGRITAYPGRSRYQIVIERLELAGQGALLKLLEERKAKLAAEGLFAEDRKRALPYLPEVIGVVTSPIVSRATSWCGRCWFRARVPPSRSPPPFAASIACPQGGLGAVSRRGRTC
jgi:exodeoxyribonuclease VII large subunit